LTEANEVIVDGKPVRITRIEDTSGALMFVVRGSPDKGYSIAYHGDEDAVLQMVGQAMRAFAGVKS
jgi:hypothetical protein